MTIAGNNVTEFGNIQPGAVYYIRSISNPNLIEISIIPSGPTYNTGYVNPGSGTGGIFTNQRNVIQLSNATGSLNVYIGSPVSPGQINGQRFTVYPTSSQYTDLTGPNGNIIERSINASLSTINALAIEQEQGIDNFYTNMPFILEEPIGGLAPTTTYYVGNIGTLIVNCTSTLTNNLIQTLDTDNLYDNMPIIFSGIGLGGIEIGREYFVTPGSIVPDTGFKISFVKDGEEVDLSLGAGPMVGTGADYFTVNSSIGGPEIILTAEIDENILLIQEIDTSASFDVSYILGGYRTLINNPGQGYAVSNTITIRGSSLGGTDANNTLTLTVNAIDDEGGITSVIAEGNPIGLIKNYYFKVITIDTVAVYENPLMTVPADFSQFPYVGYTTTIPLSANGNVITLQNTADFDLNDMIIFTGTLGNDTNIQSGTTYYINTLVGNDITLTTDPGSGNEFEVCKSPITSITWGANTVTAAKPGSFAFLPEPFYFNQSIVKYNNRVWECVLSNNDDTFILGKWAEMRSDDRRLNAMDRAIGYYQPTDNMPGIDLTQLYKGVTYPNSTYLGNAFDPFKQFSLDTVLQDEPFYPTNIDMPAIIYNGQSYLVPANLPNYSGFILDETGNNWEIAQLANRPLGLTDIIYAAGFYIMTTTNSATPIFRSNNGTAWSTNGYFTPYGSTPFDDEPYDMTSLNVASLSLQSVAHNVITVTYPNGKTENINRFVAVGENVVTSDDTFTWNETYELDPTETLYAITKVDNDFYGYVAVGKGASKYIVLTSETGLVWVKREVVSSAGLFSLCANSDIIVAGGENGLIVTSTDAEVWTQGAGIATTGIIKDIIYVAPYFIAVGEDGLIARTTDPTGAWTILPSGTTKTLNAINYVAPSLTYTAVGNDNTLITSEDNGDSWTGAAVFNVVEPAYTVSGGPFEQGYAPEELVAGVVRDQLAMTVTTRPGTNWDAQVYAGVGYKVISTELLADISNVYSFADLLLTPQQILVSYIDSITNLSTTLYENIDYTVNWIDFSISLINPIDNGSIRIDIYETGNGNQLVKANTNTDPLRINTTTGFNEIYLNCRYNATIFEGGGIIRFDSGADYTNVLYIEGETNSIFVDDISDLAINDQIKFQGNVYGGIDEDPVAYYVKTISTLTKSITISDTLISGVAGPTLSLTSGPTTGEGPMFIVIESGLQNVWTDPAVYHNGQKLVLGKTTQATGTRSSTNTVTCLTISGLIAGQTIYFDANIYGNIEPLTTYNILQIVDANEFTLEDPNNLGNPLLLTDAAGVSTFITNDYAIGATPNGINAKLMFANQYDTDVDYLSYTMLGETEPEQFGYSMPEPQIFIGNGTVGPYTLTNFISKQNPKNAIVEINGLRINTPEYVIDDLTQTITFTSLTPSSNDNICVTTFNDTARQYLNTQTIINKTVSNIVNIDNTFALPAAITTISATLAGSEFVCPSTETFVGLNGQYVQFKAPLVAADEIQIGTEYSIQYVGDTDWNSVGYVGIPVVGGIFEATGPGTGTGTAIQSSMGGISTLGTVYLFDQVIGPTTFTITDMSGDPVNTFPSTGLLQLLIGGQNTIRVETGTPHNYATNDLIRIGGLNNFVQLNNKQFYVHVINDTEFDLYEYDPNFPELQFSYAVGATNYPIRFAIDNGLLVNGYTWMSNSFMIYTTSVIEIKNGTTLSGKVIVLDDVQDLILKTPIYFTKGTSAPNVNILGGLLCDVEYYISEIDYNNNQIKVSLVRNGESIALVDAVATELITVSQWSQNNVDRLYVTIDGYRVPSSQLYLYNINELGILSPITSSQTVMITSMIPTATPDEEVYMNFVNEQGEGTVYRANTNTRTWLTQELIDLSGTIYVENITRLTNVITQNTTVDVPIDNHFYIGLTADKNDILQIKVYNNNPERQGFIQPQYVQLDLINTAPQVKITYKPYAIQPGDHITITTVTGKIIFINGEEIAMYEVNLDDNTITSFQRGANGTIVNERLPKYTEVYSKLEFNRMSDNNYRRTWNSYNYNKVEGDPLQISTTPSAQFLDLDIT